MTQTIILNQLQWFVKIKSKQYLQDLENKKKDKNLSLEEINKEIEAHRLYVDDLITALTTGNCHGFSIFFGAMHIIGKRSWGKHALHTLALWDGLEKSLKNEVNIPDSILTGTNKTLDYLFTRILNYVVYYQSVFDNGYGFRLSGMMQSNLLQANQKINPNFEIIDGNKIATIKNQAIAAGYFTREDLIALLDENQMKESIGLIVSMAIMHTIFFGYDGKDWLLYNPNNEHSQLETIEFKGSKTESINEIIKKLGNDLVLVLANINENQKLSFPHFDYLLKNKKRQLIRNFGLHSIAKYLPNVIVDFFQEEKDQVFLNELTEALLKKNKKNSTPLSFLAEHPTQLLSLMHLARKKKKIQLMSTIEKGILEKNDSKRIILHSLAIHNPLDLINLIDLLISIPSAKLHQTIETALLEKDGQSYNSLHYLATYNPIELIQLFQLIIKNKNKKLFLIIKKAMLKKASNLTWTPMHFLARYHPVEMMQLIDLVINATNASLLNFFKELLLNKSNQNWTPLHILARYNASVFNQLIQKFPIDACLLEKNEDGDTPLHLLAQYNGGGLMQLIELAINTGKQKRLIFIEEALLETNKNQETPIHLLAKYNSKILTQLIKLCKKRHTKITTIIETGYLEKTINNLSLGHCIAQFSADALISLIELTKDIPNRKIFYYLEKSFAEKTPTNWTIAHFLAQSDPKGLIQLISWSKKTNNLKLLQLIQENLISKTADGWTPIHLLARYGINEFMRLIKEASQMSEQKLLGDIAAILVEKNSDQWTPIHLLAQNNPEQLIELVEFAIATQNEPLMAAIGQAFQEKNQNELSPIQLLVMQQPKKLFHLIELIAASENQELIEQLAKTFLQKDQLQNTSLHMLAKDEPFELIKLIKLTATGKSKILLEGIKKAFLEKSIHSAETPVDTLLKNHFPEMMALIKFVNESPINQDDNLVNYIISVICSNILFLASSRPKKIIELIEFIATTGNKNLQDQVINSLALKQSQYITALHALARYPVEFADLCRLGKKIPNLLNTIFKTFPEEFFDDTLLYWINRRYPNLLEIFEKEKAEYQSFLTLTLNETISLIELAIKEKKPKLLNFIFDEAVINNNWDILYGIVKSNPNLLLRLLNCLDKENSVLILLSELLAEKDKDNGTLLHVLPKQVKTSIIDIIQNIEKNPAMLAALIKVLPEQDDDGKTFLYLLASQNIVAVTTLIQLAEKQPALLSALIAALPKTTNDNSNFSLLMIRHPNVLQQLVQLADKVKNPKLNDVLEGTFLQKIKDEANIFQLLPLSSVFEFIKLSEKNDFLMRLIIKVLPEKNKNNDTLLQTIMNDAPEKLLEIFQLAAKDENLLASIMKALPERNNAGESLLSLLVERHLETIKFLVPLLEKHNQFLPIFIETFLEPSKQGLAKTSTLDCLAKHRPSFAMEILKLIDQYQRMPAPNLLGAASTKLSKKLHLELYDHYPKYRQTCLMKYSIFNKNVALQKSIPIEVYRHHIKHS